MKINVEIKPVGNRYGTAGWLQKQISTCKIRFRESNTFYIPPWSTCGSVPKVQTHGLVIYDDNEHSALIAYRTCDGIYECNVEKALGNDVNSHWCLNLTKAAINVIKRICISWIKKVQEDGIFFEALESYVESETETFKLYPWFVSKEEILYRADEIKKECKGLTDPDSLHKAIDAVCRTNPSLEEKTEKEIADESNKNY